METKVTAETAEVVVTAATMTVVAAISDNQLEWLKTINPGPGKETVIEVLAAAVAAARRWQRRRWTAAAAAAVKAAVVLATATAEATAAASSTAAA